MLRDLKIVKDTRELGGSYVILDRNNFSGMNDLRIKHSYDDFGSYVKLPPKEWKLLGSKWFVDIYEIPEGWTYVEPDEKELVLGALLYSVKINDVMLFLNSLHPDFPSLISLKPLSELFETLGKENGPMRYELLEKRLEYRKYNGRWKIQFVMH